MAAGGLKNIELHFESPAVTIDKIMFKAMERLNIKVVL
jgi:hypothetical protein